MTSAPWGIIAGMALMIGFALYRRGHQADPKPRSDQTS